MRKSGFAQFVSVIKKNNGTYYYNIVSVFVRSFNHSYRWTISSCVLLLSNEEICIQCMYFKRVSLSFSISKC